MTTTLSDLKRWAGLVARRHYLRREVHLAVRAGAPTYSLRAQINAIEGELEDDGVSCKDREADEKDVIA